MPARMIRETLLQSDRFLGLPDNTARICFVSILLNADDRGNMEASPGRLVRMWRDFGVDTVSKACLIADSLANHDLIRMYEADTKTFLHVPRFRQRKRHLTRACPESPWCSDLDNQQDDFENDGREPDERQADDGLPSAEVNRSEGKGREKKSAGSRRSLVPMPNNFAISDAMRAWAAEKGVFNLEAHFEYFVDTVKSKDYRYADWDRALMKAVAKDWAGIGKGGVTVKKVAL